MLELKHVTKTYRAKKGNKTVALNDVSLKFKETGLVFILGKSGSGKSTLLNVLGGLDRYDDGEIIIQGKSSRQFKQREFDSYRNTYIGFIFQEFNILEDYTVYRNVALALQLQRKKDFKDKIEFILEKLDLKGLEHRKTNELSGGQKQRVAIARALVKNPDIIMADEPTGSLDSITGEQVFRILKGISKDKLVIIVSHDQEAAKLYADRIIEFKDGQVIRDTDEVDEVEVIHPFKLIRSKLPWKESFKLGLGSLNHKKIRLTFTILLASFALCFLGLADTMSSFDVAKSHAKLVSEKKADLLFLKHFKNNKVENQYQIPFKEKEISKMNFKGIKSYKILNEGRNLYLNDLGVENNKDISFYMTMNKELQIIELDKKEDFIKEDMVGKYPTSLDEIVISNYLADFIMEFGITTALNDKAGLPVVYKPKSYEELVVSNKYINFGKLKKVKIVGVIQYDIGDYVNLKNKLMKNLNAKDNMVWNDLSSKANTIYNKVFVKTGFVDDINVSKANIYVSDNINSNFKSKEEDIMGGYRLAILDHEVSYYDGKTWKKTSTLEPHQMLISLDSLGTFKVSNNYEEKLKEYMNSNPDGSEKAFFENYINKYAPIGTKLGLYLFEGYSFNSNKPDYKYDNIEIIGVVDKEATFSNTYLSKDILKPFVDNTAEVNEILIKEGDKDKLEILFKQFPYDSSYSLKSRYSEMVEGLVGVMNVLKKVAFYASLVFLGFAIFLIMNFIFTSIAYRKKEIGILRAIGARSIDVLKIFLWEGIIIATVSGLLAITGTIVASLIINNFIFTNLNLPLTFFMVTIRQVGLIGITVFTIVFVASILPIIKIGRMKPIDAILNK